MAGQNIARLGVVLGIDTAEFSAGIDKAISDNKKLKASIQKETNAAAKEILALKFATEDYGKSLTKVEEIQREISSGKYLNATKQAKDMLLEQARAYDAVTASAKKAGIAQMSGMGTTANGKLPPHLQAALGYQTTDIVTSLLGGQNPMMVLIQQGGQLRDQFGGFVPLFKAITGVLTPMNLAIGALAIAMGGLGYAFYAGLKESTKLRDELILTNNIAGITASSFQMLSVALSDKLNISVGKTKDVFSELIASGKFTSTSLASVANAVALIAKLSGESASAVAKDLIPSLDGSANSAARLNERFNFLSFAQYRQIELLAQQGKKQEAIKLTTDLLTDSLSGQERNLGTLEKAWNGLTSSLGLFWDTLKGIGRADTTESVIEKLKKDIIDLQIAINQPTNALGKDMGFQKQLEEKRKLLVEMQEKLAKDNDEIQKKAIKQANENKQISAYQEAGGLQKAEDLKAEYAKLKADEVFQRKVFGVNEVVRIEMESAKKISDFSIEERRKSEREKGVFSTQHEQLIAQFAINENLRVDQAKQEIYRKERLKFSERQQGELDSIAREKERLNIYQENILSSDNDKQIALDRLRTEQKLAEIYRDQKLSLEDKAYLAQRERGIQLQREGVIKLGEDLKLVESIHSSVFNNMNSAIENFVKTGKFAFADFTRSVIQDIIAIQLKAQATKLLSMGGGLLSSYFGGNSPFAPNPSGGALPIGDVSIYGDGGDPPVGVPAIVGDRGPELFIPRTAGTIIPNHALGAMGGTTVNYNGTYIANMSAIDTQSATQFLVQNKQTIWAANQSASRSMPTSR
jgi:phage-related minor tail protein